MKRVRTTDLRRDLDIFAQVVGSGRSILVTNHGKDAFGMVPAEWAELIDQVLQFDLAGAAISDVEWKAILETQFKEMATSERPTLAGVIQKIVEAAVIVQRYRAMKKQVGGG